MCRDYKSGKRSIYGNNCLYRQGETQQEVEEREYSRSSCDSEGKKKVQVCVSQNSDPKKSIPRKAGQTRLNASAGHTIKFSRRAWYAIQIWEITGPS